MESRMDKIQRLGQEADAELRHQAAEAERAKVVQWLRGASARYRSKGMIGEALALEVASDCIEARAHLGAEINPADGEG
jgi:hypothetical protein